MPDSEQLDPSNRKAYVWKWERRETPGGHTTDYWFCEFAKDAAYWESCESAENAVSMLNIGVRIPSIHGGIHSLRNFTLEPFEDKFVIYCSGPFIYSERGTAVQEP
jgi:hypothetical protein